MDAALRDHVRLRAKDRCEYCLTSQQSEQFFRYQIEHVIARQHGGDDREENLALACPHCNRHKGPNIAGIDPLDGGLVALFNPRMQTWTDHFVRQGDVIVGLTPIGRATVAVLDMNAPLRVDLRSMSAGG